jgi:hypothetical protein
MDIHEASRSYEAWLRRQTKVRPADLRHKHERMRESPFVFLRGTFYRWLQHWPETCAEILDAPAVLAVGDLHVENFGTWRDAEGRLVWGVNDVDEACRLPYTQDLVRLATSALLAIHEGRFAIRRAEACAAILDGYSASLDAGGNPVVVAERRRWLRVLALNRLRDPTVFWEKLTELRTATGPAPEKLLRGVLPARDLPFRTVRRVAGVGSLGRPRFVALATWRGGLVAREAKAVVPSAARWIDGRPSRQHDSVALLKRAIRDPDPFFRLRDGWVVRRLAPDCFGIDLNTLPDERDELKLLRTMGWETANLHLGTARDSIRRDLRRRPSTWLVRAATRMSDVVSRDWRAWRR